VFALAKAMSQVSVWIFAGQRCCLFDKELGKMNDEDMAQ